MTRQQRFEKMVAAYWTASQADDQRAYDAAQFKLGYYVAQNAHLVTIQSGNGVQEAMRARAGR